MSPDGKVATQTRSRMRDTPGGATVRETQTQRREVVTPGAGGAGGMTGDATKPDPAK